MESKTILIVEDEPEVRSYLETALKCQGYSVEAAEDGEEALMILQYPPNPIAAVLLDIAMPRKDGLETLKEIRKQRIDVPVIMLSGASLPVNIVQAIKIGATDFIMKPASPEDLRGALKRALEGRYSAAEAEAPPVPILGDRQFFLGSNPFMREIRAVLQQVGQSEVPVLIQGETGSGKEVLARALHANSMRAGKRFLKLNCAALPSELVESELFGYERGAFTGAFQKKLGIFELANGGTLMLDEIGDMDFSLQAKLLQVLQDGEFQRLGGKETVTVDVRVIAATHRNLEKAIQENEFREDLYYRLNVINLKVPPLRECKDDLIGLAEFLMRKHLPAGAVMPVITPALRQAMIQHDWPGNTRELENFLRKFLVLRDADALARDLRAKMNQRKVEQMTPATETSAPAILEQVTMAKQSAERSAILAALDSTHWNRKRAASLLRIDYKALLYKMKKLEIEDKMVTFPSDEARRAAAAV